MPSIPSAGARAAARVVTRGARDSRVPRAPGRPRVPAPAPPVGARASSPRGTRLEWPGRLWEPGRAGREAGEASTTGGASAIETLEEPAGGGDGALPRAVSRAAWPARLIHGDALEVAAALRQEAQEGAGGGADLVYLDPPFASQAAYVHEARVDGPSDGRVLRAVAYDDRWAGGGPEEYLDMLAPRLEAAAALLAPTGTLWVHLDWRACYLVRAVLDEILGRDAFVNEIVWRRAPNLGRQAASHQFGRTLDTLVVYGGERATLVPPTRLEPIEPGAIRRDGSGRPFTTAPRGDYTDESIARLEAEGRVHRTASGKAYVKYFLVQRPDGVWCRERRVDALWTDVAPLRHAPVGERTGYPTQKPRALLDRIVACACPPGGLVVDLFGGSGTTGESAHALGRRFVLGDVSPLSIATARARLHRAGAPLRVEACGNARAPAGEVPRVSVARRAGSARVELLAPREPLAWAIGTEPEAGAPLRVAWHSERVPGARARAAVAGATIEVDAAAPLAVRVWYDDGRVGTWRESAP